MKEFIRNKETGILEVWENGKKIGEIIKNYLESIKKANLLNVLDYKICIDSIWFIYNGSAIKISDYDKKASEFFFF